MSKQTVTMTIDMDVWSIMKSRFPDKISGIVESYMRDLCNVQLESIDFKSKKSVLIEQQKIESEISQLKLKKAALQKEKERIEEERKKKLDAKNKEQDQIIDENFELFRQTREMKLF